MAQDLYLFNFNNYYNRIVKKYNTLDEYLSEGDLIQTVAAVNFNPNDSVATSHVVNLDSLTPTPDYLLVLQDNIIISRWYVIEAKKTSYAQYQLTLLRDVVADWYDDIVNAPMYIEKGFVNINDPAIWNGEDIQVNQIKHAEHPLKDPTGCPWIVGYCARDTGEQTITIPEEDIRVDYEGFDSFPYNEYTEEPFLGALTTSVITIPLDERPFFTITFPPTKGIYFNSKGSMSSLMPGYARESAYIATRVDGATQIYDSEDRPWLLTNVWECKYDTVKEYFNTQQGADAISSLPLSEIDFRSYWNYGRGNLPCSVLEQEAFLREDGKIIADGGSYFKINIIRVEDSSKLMAWTNFSSQLGLTVEQLINKLKNEAILPNTSIPGTYNPYYMMYQRAPAYLISYEKMPVEGVTVVMKANHQKLNDAGYDMFCLPYGDIRLQPSLNVDSGITSSATLNMRLAQELGTKLDKKLYDLQLLPYCPLPRNVISEGSILSYNLPYVNGVERIYNSKDETLGYLYWCDSSTFSIDINMSFDTPIDAIEFKVANQCEMMRLVSPNYNGQFEFTATKNNGVSYFTVDCTYKPYSPYIKVAPYFGGLYGQDFDDARGLICGGDFSLPIMLDPWIEYQINNKNYANMFDRQVENLEFSQSQERTLGLINAITGSVSGTATGAMAGAAAGPWGALAGGIVGGAASITGGLVDYQMMEARHAEVIDYTKDQFNMSLQNIKAMPQSLSKVSAFNANNKIYPILEIYKATPIEEEAVRNKIRYNGMKIGRIGTLADMISLAPEGIHYYKGKVIRFGNIGEDYHVAVEISNELNRGVYIES